MRLKLGAGKSCPVCLTDTAASREADTLPRSFSLSGNVRSAPDSKIATDDRQDFVELAQQLATMFAFALVFGEIMRLPALA